jgi:hypothetical protein
VGFNAMYQETGLIGRTLRLAESLRCVMRSKRSRLRAQKVTPGPTRGRLSKDAETPVAAFLCMYRDFTGSSILGILLMTSQ